MTCILLRRGIAGLGLLAAVALSRGLAVAETPLGAADRERDFRVILEVPHPLAVPSLPYTSLGGRLAVSANPPARESGGVDTICSRQTMGFGWAEPMKLHLGAGAAAHIETVRRAVQAWNGLTKRNLIELQEDDAHYPLSALQPDEEGASALYADGASVLYFSARGTGSKFGYVLAHQKTNEDGDTHLAEADIFIWTPPETDSPLDLLIAVQHELGHALGLEHTAISGNVMSYDYRPAIEADVTPFVYLGLLPDYDDTNLLPEELSLFEDPQHLGLLLRLVRPREQDKTAILCLYPFSYWGNTYWRQ